MVRKSVSATVSVALCLMSVSPALAQEYRFTGFDPPQGATATVNLRVPIGNDRNDQRRQPTYGLTLGYGYDMGGPNMNGRTMTREPQPGRLPLQGDPNCRMRGSSPSTSPISIRTVASTISRTATDNTWLIVGGIVVAGLVICLLADCFGGDDDDEDDDPVVNPL